MYFNILSLLFLLYTIVLNNYTHPPITSGKGAGKTNLALSQAPKLTLENTKRIAEWTGNPDASQSLHTETPSLTDTLPHLSIPARKPGAETGSAFMARIDTLPLEEREEEIFKALAAGNLPDFLREPLALEAEFADSNGMMHTLRYEVLPDYLAVGSNEDYCRIPMNPHTAQRLADVFGASLITAKLSDHIYSRATIRLEPYFYKPVGNANETVEKFVVHNTQIEKQKAEAGGTDGQLIAGIKKDVILSERIAQRTDRVVIYGWHEPDGVPIQPVYSGHIDWYVDYSHGIRFMNAKVLLDGEAVSVSAILKDPILYRLLSNESRPMEQTIYKK